MDPTSEKEHEKLSLLSRFKNLIGVGLYLLLIVLLLEALTLIMQQWLSFPISMIVEIQIKMNPYKIFDLETLPGFMGCFSINRFSVP